MTEKRDGSQAPGHDIPLPENGLSSGIEERTITPDILWQDNRSPKAKNRRVRFEGDESDKSQITIFRCSDSRYILTYRHSIAISSIATGGPKESFKGIIGKEGSPGIIILPHEACGGLGAKSVLEEYGFSEEPNEIEWYLRTHVLDQDPVVLAAKSATNISRIVPEKPVLAAVHKHDTGDILPLAIYRDGKPTFSTQLPEEFSDFMAAQNGYVSHIKSEYPDLTVMQQSQNPELTVITRDDRPLEVMFPDTTRKPGSAFRIMSSRPSEGSIGGVDPEDAQLIIAQARYPIENFSALNTLLVTSEDGTAASEIIMQLLRKPWAKAWAIKPDSKIYSAKMNHGELEAIEEFAY